MSSTSGGRGGGGEPSRDKGRFYFIGFYKIIVLFPPIVRNREGVASRERPIVKHRLVYSRAEPVYCQG